MVIFKLLSKLLIMRLISYILLLLLIVSCKQQETKKDNLGVVNITITGKKSAQPNFEKGLLLLHSFEYEDAREAFIEAQKEDPKMPMAYWGEAMTYNHSLWQQQDYEAATTVLAKLDSINLEKNTTEIEKDLIESVHILYQPKTEKKQRDIAYSEFMEGLYKKYPANQEVAAFYALSLQAVLDYFCK